MAEGGFGRTSHPNQPGSLCTAAAQKERRCEENDGFIDVLDIRLGDQSWVYFAREPQSFQCSRLKLSNGGCTLVVYQRHAKLSSRDPLQCGLSEHLECVFVPTKPRHQTETSLFLLPSRRPCLTATGKTIPRQAVPSDLDPYRFRRYGFLKRTAWPLCQRH